MAHQTSAQATAHGTQGTRPPSAAPPSDGLNLPLPPVTLDFAIRGDGKSDGYFQRYARKGDANDATSAVIGKGGFGTAYRFVRDDSFTPPNSLMDATVNSADHDLSRRVEPQQLYHVTRRESLIRSETYPSRDVQSHAHALHSHNHLSTGSKTVRSSGSVPPSPQLGSSTARVSNPATRNKAPAVVVVKVCRTPTSGSYDELPKTGVGRTEAKVAAQEIAAGNPVGQHTRIVRGEARLLRYLQMCRAIEGSKGRQSHVVRLLADIPMPKAPGREGARSHEEDDDNYSGPPVPRLLIFERLVDLDAELTSRGWAKSKQMWTVEKVEAVSRDALAGLQFLHTHAIVHGDLKPSNFMRDARTGAVKLIDLGASRRWVRLHNVAKERTTAVEELDRAVQDGHMAPRRADDLLCEGLGSLTGSPHFMAPEVLLQAGRYLSNDGMAHNVLDDYMTHKNRLPRHPSVAYLNLAYRDFKRGWGIKADIWSWGCSVLSLLLRTIESGKRPSSNTVCAFDFSFDRDEDSLPPLWPLHSSNDSLPRFHQWARLYGLRIVHVVDKGVELPDYASSLSAPYTRMLQASFTHQDSRPAAGIILEYLDSHTASNVEYMSDIEVHDVSRAPSRAHSIAPSFTSVSSIGPSMPEDPHNIDLTVSSSLAVQNASNNVDQRLQASEQNLVVPVNAPPGAHISIARSSNNLRSQAAHRPLSSPALGNVQVNPLASQAPSPLHPSHVQRLSLHQRPESVASERGVVNSEKSSIASEMNMQLAGADHIPPSPGMSIYTAVSTPIMEAKSIQNQTPVYNRSEYSTIPRDGTEEMLASKSVPHLGIASAAAKSNDSQPWSAANNPQHRSGKGRRGSIFMRMASSLAPRLQTRDSTSSVSQLFANGEHTARLMHGKGNRGINHRASGLWQGSEQGQNGASPAIHSSTSMEFLRDHAPNTSNIGLEGQTLDNNARMNDVEMRDRSHSVGSRNRKSTAYNILGLELGNALQAPLRTVRSFASLRNPSGASVGSQQQSDKRASAMHSPRSDRYHDEVMSPLPSSTIHGAPSATSPLQQSYSPSTQQAISSAISTNASMRNVRSSATLGSVSMSPTRAHANPAPFVHEQGMPHTTTAGSFGQGGAAKAFLQSDPYKDGASSSHATAAATAAAAANTNGASQQSSAHRRQRSWSSLFRRSKRP